MAVSICNESNLCMCQCLILRTFMFIFIYWTSLVLDYTGYKQILKQSQLKTVWNVRMESLVNLRSSAKRKEKLKITHSHSGLNESFFMYKPLCSVFLSLSISFTSSDASLFFSWQIYVMKPSISSMDRYIISFIYHVYILNMLFSKFCWFLRKLHCLNCKKKKKIQLLLLRFVYMGA